jgi:hypothetical protein
MAVTKTNAVFRGIIPCGSCKNRRFGGTYSLYRQGDKNRRARKKLVVTSNQSTRRNIRTYAVNASYC